MKTLEECVLDIIQINESDLSIEYMKNNLDSSLGDNEKFNNILNNLRKLNDDDFEEIAKTALRVTFKSKKQGLERLIRLHNSTRADKLKKLAYAGKSAA